MQDHSQNIVIKQLSPSKERMPLFIVGDVHGCAKELSDLIKKAKERTSEFQLVLVGDLFTKGPDPVGVFELIQEHKALCIKGNHDWALWASLIQASRRGVQSLPEHTRQTLHLIRYHRRAIFDYLSTLPHAYTSTVAPRVPRKDWESEYAMAIVHAGIDPTQGLSHTSERMLLTARYVRWDANESRKRLLLVPSGYRSEVLNSQAERSMVPSDPRSAAPSQAPHATQGNAQPSTSAKSAPVASSAGKGGKDTPRASLPGGATEKFRWHELHRGPELIVFGHDAKQGLFRKTLPSGRPICVGIDTGCTYGRSLTGYFPEFDDAIQVAARRAYFDIAKNVILVRNPHPRVAV